MNAPARTVVQRFEVDRRPGTVGFASLARPHGLLMTATITPPADSVARSDPSMRRHDYEEALAFHLSLPTAAVDRILFVDNSGSDLGPLARLAQRADHGKRVELVSFEGNEYTPTLGKAYGEFRLMEFGLSTSLMFEPDDVIWKVTGRLMFRNLASMVEALSGGVDIACDLHDVPWVGTGRWRGNRYMDLRAFAFSMRAWNAVLSGLCAREGEAFDWYDLYGVVQAARGRFRVVPRFPLQPLLSGASGRHDRAYDEGWQRRKVLIRAALRRVAPWLWI